MTSEIPEAGRPRVARTILQPLFIPKADPADAAADRWFAATGFGPVQSSAVPGHQIDPSAALARAAMLTTRATEAAGVDKDSRTADVDKASRAAAASLHVLAAELRREAGEWALCAENYDALARHYLTLGEYAPTLAYLRRLTFVTESSGTPAAQVDAHLLAAKIYHRVRQDKAAQASLKRAAALAVRSSDFSKLRELTILAGEIRSDLNNPDNMSLACSCGALLPCSRCFEGAEQIPAEFLCRAVGMDTTPSRPASSPWWSASHAGIDLLMDLPGPLGEAPYWVAHGIEGGRHSLYALPNWSARAMQSARSMHLYAVAHADGFEGPSSAVLQVACALESFINTVIHFVGHGKGARFANSEYVVKIIEQGKQAKIESEKDKSDPKLSEADLLHLKSLMSRKWKIEHILNASSKKNSGSLFEKWSLVGEAMFGENWSSLNRLDDLQLMMDLRGSLAHFKEDNIERIAPQSPLAHPLMVAFAEHQDFQGNDAIRPGLLPWIDRLLTPHLAGWAVTLGEELIAGFRATWKSEIEAFERNQWLNDQDEMDDEPDEMIDEPDDGRSDEAA